MMNLVKNSPLKVLGLLVERFKKSSYIIKFFFFSRNKSDAIFVLGNLGHRWVYINRPDLYFLEIGRFKVSSSIVEMMFGVYCIIFMLLPAYLSFPPFHPLVVLSVITVLIFSFATIYRFRLLQIDHAVGAILTIWLLKQDSKVDK